MALVGVMKSILPRCHNRVGRALGEDALLAARPCLLPADDASESMVVAREDNEEDGEVGASESKVSREVIVAREDRKSVV